MSAVSGRPGKASGAHRKDARGMSIFGLSMVRFHAALGMTWKQRAHPCVSTGRSIHVVPSITPSPREGIDDWPRGASALGPIVLAEADQRDDPRPGRRTSGEHGRQQAGALGRRRGQTGKFSAVPVPAVYEASRRQPVRRDVRQKTPPRARAQASVWPENGRDGMARWGDSQKPEIGNFPARSSCQPPSRRRPIWGRWQCSPALSAWATSR